MSFVGTSTLSPVSVVDALTLALRSRVLDGNLTPGTPVTEVEVARAFQVARPTAKAAIRTLVHDGLLRQEVNHASYVPRLSSEDIDDLFLVRVPIEMTVISLVCERHRPQDVTSMHAAIHALSSLDETDPTSAFVEADLAFHRALVDAANSARMTRIYGQLIGEIHLCMMQTRTLMGAARIIREHMQILKAIESSDAQRGVARISGHLEAARVRLLSRA